MIKVSFVGGAALLAAAGTASGAVIANNPVADRPTLTTGFAELDLASYAANAGFGGLSGANNNIFTTSFAAGNGSFSGTLTAEVYGDTQVGPGLSEVIIVYSFVGNGFDGATNFTAIDGFDLGINSGFEIDKAYLDAATHGRVTAEVTALQGDPVVETFDNGASNDTFRFNFNLAGGGADPLGGFEGNETYTWFVRGDAATKINVVDVTVTDGSVLTTQTLSFVTNPGQPDLDVPAPGALALLGAGLGLAGSRRRRG